jgi:predicted membrane-bound spermidine synthase
MKDFKVKLVSLDPTGAEVDSKELSMSIHDKNSMSYSRLYIEIGDCIYRIDNKGDIIEKVKQFDVMT